MEDGEEEDALERLPDHHQFLTRRHNPIFQTDVLIIIIIFILHPTSR